jgi:hypothetical protein
LVGSPGRTGDAGVVEGFATVPAAGVAEGVADGLIPVPAAGCPG